MLFEHATEPSDPKTDLPGIDARSVEKLRDILSLPVEGRNDLYHILCFLYPVLKICVY
jgi:hypothetical protein